jgi:zinc transporter ZupT
MAISSGIVFWFFLDVMNDAVLLDVNQGFVGGVTQLLLVTAFAAGVLLLFGLEYVQLRFAGGTRSGSSASSISFVLALLVALAIGFHALAEGVVIGSVLPTTSNMIDAIGGFAAGAAYVLHKLLEGFVIGTFAAFVKSTAPRTATLGLVSGIPTGIGMVLALLGPINSTFFFALGGAGALYIEFRLIPNFANKENVGIYLALLLGFFLMYFAGLLHG